MAVDLARIDRIPRTYTVSAKNPDGTAATITGVALALLPPRTNPNASTVWITTTYAAGSTSVVLAGPDADSTGAIVATGNADLWMRVTYTTGVDAAKVERVTVLGGGTVANLTAVLDAPTLAALNTWLNSRPVYPHA